MVLILVIALPPIIRMALCDERVRLHGLDLSTICIVDDSREPEIKKPRRMPGLVNLKFKYQRDFVLAPELPVVANATRLVLMT
ncbi:hypothetical protein F9P46_16625 [Salmonella enterica subsp. enterica]|nr:hypothetical protein [Salmonella enterica subsp. enterica serovar Alachua]EDU9875892.1 hypothetical protein [Salmonella enterica subsp. enterica]EDC3935087.1 hypothetical protein [Salmonella enterica subsp. enterica serovar Alachua]EDM8931839.1 hypothetical protein [Salmonella enterica subsp. enterica serovar Alachua]EDY7333992.1 hypothetical protein [Salmonella enterica subsp. enterica serovar Alachua]